MSKKENPQDDKLRPHVYDGIQEYDNRLPNWWLWTFYGAVILTVMYWFSWYNADVMETDAAIVEAQMAKVEEVRLAAMGEISNDTLWQMSRNAGFVSAGSEIFKDKCVACHGADLKGGIGVNLVDDEWKWGNQPISLYSIVVNGSPDKKAGMQAWINELGAQKVSQVVAYVLSYHTEQEMADAPTLNPPLEL
ncbi:c-type cytochrome [Puniceicoccales bacterium CK1056]|uniref:C-type cytochrome n=1 Tax=Oceanipulchritudo coccoides TaxID=2706888 RepID=A0A6B2LY72_9BACT|nr:cbb3-type cytochrome c oxidase N-terminal domain-containing protein [Oceanipulchritudo coccoides]NDV60864.1 c-type cytochrome [Oceanipulchritudo coccoides]